MEKKSTANKYQPQDRRYNSQDSRLDLSEPESLHVPQVVMAEDGPVDPAMLAAAQAAQAAADATAFEKPQVRLWALDPSPHICPHSTHVS